MKKVNSRDVLVGALVIALVPVLDVGQSFSQSSGGDQSRSTGAATPAQPQAQKLPPSSGGTARTGDNRSSEAGKKKIEECMGVWDAGTHMTKQEWRATCERSLSQSPTVLIPELPPDNAIR